MIIRSLKLQNYRKYKDSLVEFPDGLFGILGKNGAGKTSLVEAIAWAIYGNKGSKTGSELIKREEADLEADCGVELEFTLGSDSYHVTRKLRGRKQLAYSALSVNNQHQVEGTSAVTKYLSNKLGMDYNSFCTSIFTKQKELDALSDLSPSKRKERILKLLRIDSIDVAIKKLRSDKRNSEEIVKGIKATFQDIDELNSTLQNLKRDRIKKIENEIAEKNATNHAKEQRTKTKVMLDLQESKYTRYQSLDKNLKVDENTKLLTRKNIEEKDNELEELVSAEMKLKKILPELKPLKLTEIKKDKLDKLREKFLQKSQLENQIRDTDTKINLLKAKEIQTDGKLKKPEELVAEQKLIEDRIEAQEKKSKEFLIEIEQKKGLIGEYKRQRKKQSEGLARIKELGSESKCPTCKKMIGDDLAQIIEHYTNEIEMLNVNIKSGTDSIKKLCDEWHNRNKVIDKTKQEKRSLENQITQNERLLETKTNIERQLEEEIYSKQNIQEKITNIGKIEYSVGKHSNVKRLLENMLTLDKQRISLESKITRIPSITKSITALKTSISKIENSIEEVSNSIRSLAFNQEDYQKAKTKHGDADRYFHKKEKDHINVKNELTAIEQKIITTTRQISDERDKRKQIEKQENNIKILGVLDSIFADFRIELISRIIPILSERSSRLFNKITEGKYPSMTLDANYKILIEDGGRQFPLERFSGGEEDLASLCLRIAISQVIEDRSGSDGISLIVLDEIFGSQDEARRSSILKALIGISSQFRQIIVITHIDGVKDALPYTFNVVETPDKSNVITSEGSPNLTLTAYNQ